VVTDEFHLKKQTNSGICTHENNFFFFPGKELTSDFVRIGRLLRNCRGNFGGRKIVCFTRGPIWGRMVGNWFLRSQNQAQGVQSNLKLKYLM